MKLQSSLKSGIFPSKKTLWDSGQICRFKIHSPTLLLPCLIKPWEAHRHTFFYFPYPAGPLCWCASQPSLQTDRCSGLRRWMGVQRWNLSEVEKNKGRRRSPSPPPRYGLTWGFYWDDAEIHFRTLHYFTADLKLLGTIGGGWKCNFGLCEGTLRCSCVLPWQSCSIVPVWRCVWPFTATYMDQLVSVPLNSEPTLLTPVHKDLGSNLDILVELKQCGRFICFCLVYFVLREMLLD